MAISVYEAGDFPKVTEVVRKDQSPVLGKGDSSEHRYMGVDGKDTEHFLFTFLLFVSCFPAICLLFLFVRLFCLSFLVFPQVIFLTL